jgi:hypothetical protein
MKRRPLIALGTKEFRALAPLWIACVTAVALHGWMSGPVLMMIPILAYGFGSIALGSQSIGHEYGYGTVSVLLSQPLDRRLVFAAKTVVLALLLGALGVVASQTLFEARFRGPSSDLLLLTALCGLFVAPAFTMLARSWLASAVFTIASTGLIWVAVTVAGTMRFGRHDPVAIAEFVETVYWPLMYGVCGAAAVASWWLFARLEAIDGAGTSIDLSRWWGLGRHRRTASPSQRSATWQLALKELHVQQMPIVLAALYAIGILLLTVPGILEPQARAHMVAPVTLLYVLGITALVGSLVSAEERQMGTLEWQLLTPVSIRQQWAIKVGVGAFLAAGLGLGLPLTLSLIAPVLRPAIDEFAALGTLLVLLFAGSVYVSSVSTSGVRAMLVALPAMLMTAGLARWLLDVMYFALHRPTNYSVFRLYRANPHYRSLVPWIWLGVTVALIAGGLVLLGYRNHRSADLPWRRVVAQVALLTALGVLSLATGMLLGV